MTAAAAAAQSESPSEATETAWLALGVNIGNRGAALNRMRASLEREGMRIERASSEVLTRPIGAHGLADFHNQVIRVRSRRPLPASEWLRHCQSAERAAGRLTTYRWGPRRADIDILLLGARGEIHVSSDVLVVPHRELGARPYLTRLLGEIGGPG